MMSLPFGAARGEGAVVAATGIMLATAPSLWTQAVINEVYALQAMLFALFLLMRTLNEGPRRMALSAYWAGLAFANHQSAIFLSPFLVSDLWSRRRETRAWSTVFGFGCLGVSLYLFLPLRSAAGPLWDWGGTYRFAAFWRHVTGWQYSSWVGLHSWNELGSALRFAGFHLTHNLAYAGLPLAAFGLWALFKRNHAGAVASSLALVVCLAFGVNFPNPDLESFYLLAYLLCAYWAGLGLLRLVQWRPIWGLLAAALLALSAGYQATHTFSSVNARAFRVPTDWVEDALATMEPGAVVLTREWDHYSPWLYLRFVKGVRPDITWIDTELLRRSWYPEFIRRVDSARFEGARTSLARLAPFIDAFESGDPYRPADIEAAYADAIFALSLGQAGPVYVDGIGQSPAEWGVEQSYLRGAPEVPWGLTMRVFRPGEQIPPLPDWPSYRNRPPSPDDSPRTRFHLELYRRMRDARARYLSSK